MKEEREKKKHMKRMSWYRPYDTVMFCPPTPGSILAKRLRTLAKETSEQFPMNIKIVERAGQTLKSLLPGLQENEVCQNDKNTCFVHKNGGSGNCRLDSIVYKGECVTCKTKGPTSMVKKDGTIVKVEREPKTSIYIGESSRSAYQRGLQHIYALKNPQTHRNNAFCKHIIEHHQGDKGVKFKVDVMRRFKRPLERQLFEGIEIFRTNAEIVMNSKLDHYQPAVGRMVVTNTPTGVRV